MATDRKWSKVSSQVLDHEQKHLNVKLPTSFSTHIYMETKEVSIHSIQSEDKKITDYLPKPLSYKWLGKNCSEMVMDETYNNQWSDERVSIEIHILSPLFDGTSP